jgi:putative methyltransferase (TIGR04325 family)
MIWQGRYRTSFECLDEMATSQTPLADAFSSQQWITKLKAMRTVALSGLYPRNSTLPRVITTLKCNVVYDFGGGSGWLFELVKNVTTLSTYVVIELPSVIRALAEEVSNSSRIQFKELCEITSEFRTPNTLLYANSVWHYLLDDEEILNVVTRISPQYILLDDLQISTDFEYYSLQRYYGTLIPCRFFELSNLIKLVEGCGYRAVSMSEFPKTYHEGTIPYVDLGESGSFPIHPPASVLFERVAIDMSRQPN